MSEKIDKIEKVGKVFIASINLSGKWADSPAGCIKVNVTSAQGLVNKNRRDFSPMTEIEGGMKDFGISRHFGKVERCFEGIPEEKVKKFWHKVSEAKRRYPGSKGKKVLYAHFEHIPDEKMDYVTSRKKVYVPRYFDLMKDKEMALFWKEQVAAGKDVVVYDFDGPRSMDGEVSCVEVTQELLVEKINDTHFPFGHGYVVAAWLKGMTPESYL